MRLAIDTEKKPSTSQLNYLGHTLGKVPHNLAPFIKDFWQINTPRTLKTARQEYFNPDGGSGLIINFGDPIKIGNSTRGTGANLDACNTRSNRVTFQGNINAIGLRFTPIGLNALLSIKAHEHRNLTSQIHSIANASIDEIANNLNETKSIPLKFGYLIKLFRLALTKPISEYQQIQYVMQLIQQSNGTATVELVANKLGSSRRYIERLFASKLGMSPKIYSNIIRANKSRTLLKQCLDLSCTDIAHRAGYYDQSHMIQEHNSIFAITPQRYREAVSRIRETEITN